MSSSWILKRWLWFIYLHVALVLYYSESISTSGYCRAKSFSFRPDAEANFAVILSLTESYDGQECARMKLSEVQKVTAIQWTVDRLNSGGYIPGVTLGFDVYDDCGIERYSVNTVLDVIGPTFPQGITECSASNKTGIFLGILGPTRSQTTESVLEILQGTHIPVVSPSATLPDLENHANFIRTTPSDTEQVKAIVELVNTLGWTYVSALHTNDNYGIHGMKGIVALAKSSGICVDVVYSIPVTLTFDDDSVFTGILTKLRDQLRRTAEQETYGSLGVIYFGQKSIIQRLLKHAADTSSIQTELRNIIWVMSDFVGTSVEALEDAGDYPDGALTVSPTSLLVQDLKDYFLQKVTNVTQGTILDNVDTMLEHYINTRVNGDLTFWHNDYVMSTIDSVVVMATGLTNAHHTSCNAKLGLCDDLFQTDWVQQMKAVDVIYSSLSSAIAPYEFQASKRTVRFDASGEVIVDVSNPLYFINQYRYINDNQRFFIQIGNFTNNTLLLDLDMNAHSVQIAESACFKDCSLCIIDPVIPYALMDGDVFLLGIFSVHDPNADDAFKCGRFRSGAIDTIVMEGFFHAVERLRDMTGVQFGAIALDDCYSSARINFFLSQFFNGAVPLYSTNKLEQITPDKVVGIVGALSSGVTVPMTHLVSSLKLPVTSYAASSPDLDDRINFPFFLRTVPSDVVQAQAMLDILKQLGWDYVSLLYTNNNYGSKGKQIFHNLAKANNICVAPPIAIPEATDDELYMHRIYTDLRRQNSKVVVYFGTDSQITKLLQVMEGQYADNRYEVGEFIFLASEDWGDRNAILEAAPSVTLGSITLKFEISHSRDRGFAEERQFPAYLNHLTPANNKKNPWFDEFWSEYFKCNLKGRFDIPYNHDNELCRDDLMLSKKQIDEFLTDQRLIHTMNAVYAVGQGLHEMKTNTPACRPDTEFPCTHYRDWVFLDLAMSYIRNISLTEGTTTFKVFNSNGNGNIGFKIMNVQRNTDGSSRYSEVGSYDQSLTLSTKNMVFYDNFLNPKQISAKCDDLVCPGCRPVPITTEAPTETTTFPPCLNGLTFRVADSVVIGTVGILCLVIIVSLVAIASYFKRRVKGLEITIQKLSRPKQYEPVTYRNEEGTSGEQSKVNFANPNSGDSLEEWRNAQNFLNENRHENLNGGFGFNNLAFQHSASEPYLHAVNDHQYDMTHSPNGQIPGEFDFDQFLHSSQGNLPGHVLPDSPPFQATCCYGPKVPGYFKRMQETPPSPDMRNFNTPNRTLPSPPGAQGHLDLRARELPNIPSPQSTENSPSRPQDFLGISPPHSNGSYSIRPPDQPEMPSPQSDHADLSPTRTHSRNVAAASTPSPSYITLPRAPHHSPDTINSNIFISPTERISRV